MAKFDTTALGRANLQPQTGQVPIPDYAQAFIPLDEGEEPVWSVRGMNGQELRRVEQQGSAELSTLIQQVAAMFGSGQDGQAAANVIDLSIAKQIETLIVGAVNPELDRDQAVMISEHFPMLALALNKKIWDLTGAGPQSGEPESSTPAPT